MTDETFQTMQHQLKIRSADIIPRLNDSKELTSTLERLLASSKNFNVIAVVNKDGILLSSSPRIGLEGSKVESKGSIEALQRKQPLISTISIDHRPAYHSHLNTIVQ